VGRRDEVRRVSQMEGRWAHSTRVKSDACARGAAGSNGDDHCAFVVATLVNDSVPFIDNRVSSVLHAASHVLWAEKSTQGLRQAETGVA
jgi:hypothetical protein